MVDERWRVRRGMEHSRRGGGEGIKIGLDWVWGFGGLLETLSHCTNFGFMPSSV